MTNLNSLILPQSYPFTDDKGQITPQWYAVLQAMSDAITNGTGGSADVYIYAIAGGL